MFAARREHLERVIRPALARGDWVLCDRFTDATFAYQGGGHGVPLERHPRARAVDPRRLPARSDVPVRRAAGGVARPARQGAARGPRCSTGSSARRAHFFERVRDAYLDRARAEPGRFRVDRQHRARRRRCAPSSERELAALAARRMMAQPSATSRGARAAVAARCCRGSRRRSPHGAGRTRDLAACAARSTARAASASTRWRSTSRRRCCAKRRATTASPAANARAAATRSPGQHPDLHAARAARESTRDEGALDGVDTITIDRIRALIDFVQLHESSPAGQGRRDRAGRAHESAGGERAAEDARGAAGRHLSHPRLRPAGASAADDPLALPQARRRRCRAAERGARMAHGAGRRGRRASCSRRRAARRSPRWRMPIPTSQTERRRGSRALATRRASR